MLTLVHLTLSPTIQQTLSTQISTVTSGLAASITALQSTIQQSQVCVGTFSTLHVVYSFAALHIIHGAFEGVWRKVSLPSPRLISLTPSRAFLSLINLSHPHAGTGRLWDSTQQQCVSPQPDGSQWATAARMLAAEQDISGIELALDQTAGNHSVCTICPLNQFVSQTCTANQGTLCSPCATGSFSRGGYAESCISCASTVPQCGYASCTSATDASCQYCTPFVEDGASYILSAPNTCTQCPQYTYRTSNNSCSACPKDTTVSCHARAAAFLHLIYMPLLQPTCVPCWMCQRTRAHVQ